jgi:amidase
MNWDIHDDIGAWVPHGRFIIEGRAGGPLAGLRFAAKDIFDVAGHPTGAGNPTWLTTHAVADRHSAVVAQLLDAGATLAGKVLTDELAYSLHGDNHHYGAPLNVRAPARVTGGSSSGSAAAVAARRVDFALGTDTGGSTRVPASYCGIWGLRTTHGLLSCAGLVPLHPSFDTVTWMAHDADVFERVGAVLLPASDYRPRRVLFLEDAAALADAEFAAPLQRTVQALAQHVGVVPQTAFAAPAEALSGWRQVYATAGAHEGWKTHGLWITQQRPVFGAAIAARWHTASQVSDEAAASARAEVARIRTQVRALLGDDGIAVLPSAASLAPRRDADPAQVDAVRLRTMAITCIAGLAGLPQVSLPLSATDGTPLGVSLLGPAGSDLALIRLATALATGLA